MQLISERRTFASPSGAQLNVRIRRSEGKPRGVVQINHGLAEHSGRYERFSDFLADHGFDSYVHDHRGHGYTKAPNAPLGRFGKPDGGDEVIADVAALHWLIADERPGLPVIIFGHSMGGLITLNYVLQHPHKLAGAAIWNANFSAGLAGRLAQIILAWEKNRLGSDVPSRLLPRLTFGAWAKQIANRRTEFDWLSRDSVEVDKYIADPLCGWDASVSLWQDLFGFVFYGADDGNFGKVPKTLPFNLVGGEKDPATGSGKSVRDLERRMKRLGFSNLETRIYPQTRHESLNEINRDAVMADFLAWADRVVPRST